MVAPDGERSGTGHSITVFDPIRVREVDLPDSSSLAWVIDGTPVDCVKLGISALVPERPDFVVSGINCGANQELMSCTRVPYQRLWKGL